MASEPAELSDDLAEFQQRFARIPDIEEPPRTLLHVLGRETRETYWNEILSYFLDPTEPHGFGTDFLEAFLSVLESNVELKFGFDQFDFEEVEIEREWVTRDTGDRPDVVIYSGRNWFICVEMKVGASEGKNQTERYVSSENIGDISKGEFPEDGRHYVYLSGREPTSASADVFADISWCEVVTKLERFQTRSQGRYPAKSLAQLDDFLDTIRREMNMTDDAFEQNQIDKMRLYFEYADAINEAEDALDKVYKREKASWGKRFLDEFEPPSWNEEWNCDDRKWGQIYRDGWRRTNELEPTDNRDEAPYRVEFRHLIEEEESFRNGELTFKLYCPRATEVVRENHPGLNGRYRKKFDERFHGDEIVEKMSRIFQECSIQRIESGIPYHLTKTYTFDSKELPESYYETLRTAFEEFQRAADIISNVLEDTLKQVQ